MLKDKQDKENELLKEVPKINQKSVKIFDRLRKFRELMGVPSVKTLTPNRQFRDVVPDRSIAEAGLEKAGIRARHFNRGMELNAK